MYKVYSGNVLIHDDRLESLRIMDARLSLEMGKSGLFDFTIYPSNPHYDSVLPLKSVIQIHRDGKNIFSGRVLSVKYGFYNEKQVSCEGELAFLLDSMIEPHTYGSSLSGYFPFILAKHNAQVENHKKFIAGNVTVADYTPFTVVENISYHSTLETLSKRLLEPSGGYLSVRRDDNNNRYLDLLSANVNISNTAKQKIRLGKNLLDLKRDIDGSDVFTAITPLGAKQDGSEIRIDIKNVNSGLAYITNAEAVAKYGLIYRQVIFDNITYPQTLKEAAEVYLSKSIAALESIEITAADLSGVDTSLDSFSVGQWVQVESAAHGVNGLYLIKKMQIKLFDPAATKIEIGRTRRGITDDLNSVVKSVSNIEVPEAVQPYVIDSGTNGIWTWKKFSDGTAECFGKINLSGVAVTGALGNWFRSETLYEAVAYPFPLEFAEAPAVQMMFQTRNGSGALLWPFSASAENAKQYLPQSYIIRPTTAASVNGNINIIAKGKV